MAIEGWIVRFASGKNLADARATMREALHDQGELVAIADAGEALNETGTVWQFNATAGSALMDEAQAWDLAYRVRGNGETIAVAEPVFLVPGMPIETAPPDLPVSFGGIFRDDHIPESAPVDWVLSSLNVRPAWAALAGAHPGQTPGHGILIGHPDTGFTAHPELVTGTHIDVARGRNYKDRGTQVPGDPLTGTHGGHGTATATVFLSAGSTQIPPGVLGTAPGATLVPMRVHDVVVHFHWGNVCRALYHAADSGCHVVSMSLGGAWGAESLHDAIQYAIGKGVILISAAGNHTRSVIYPARYPEVVALAASNARDGLWSGTALGSRVDVTAPGESVWRGHVALDAMGRPKYTVARGSGTSYATAATAGVCALWLHRHGYDALHARYGAGLANVFRSLLQSSARRVPGWPTDRAGTGIVDAHALLGTPLPAAPLPEPASHATTSQHRRISEIAELTDQSIADATAWLLDRLQTTPQQLNARLDEVGAELSLVLLRRKFAQQAPPLPMASAAAVAKSQHLSAIAPRI